MYPTCWQSPIHFQLHLPLSPGLPATYVGKCWEWCQRGWGRLAASIIRGQWLWGCRWTRYDQMAMISLGLCKWSTGEMNQTWRLGMKERPGRFQVRWWMEVISHDLLVLCFQVFSWLFLVFRLFFDHFSRHFQGPSCRWFRQAAKLRDPFRRRFTAAWCYAEALHHAVTNSPAVGQFLRTVAMANLTNLAIGAILGHNMTIYMT